MTWHGWGFLYKFRSHCVFCAVLLEWVNASCIVTFPPCVSIKEQLYPFYVCQDWVIYRIELQKISPKLLPSSTVPSSPLVVVSTWYYNNVHHYACILAISVLHFLKLCAQVLISLVSIPWCHIVIWVPMVYILILLRNVPCIFLRWTGRGAGCGQSRMFLIPSSSSCTSLCMYMHHCNCSTCECKTGTPHLLLKIYPSLDISFPRHILPCH